MERVRKTFFDPLATSKAQIRRLLDELPVGSAHPFSPERILLHRTADGVDETDISSYPEDYFYNAVDLGEMGETLLRRMAGFQAHLAVFNDFQIMQAPASTFKIPLVSGQITILAVSERTPTYYDFCFADVACNTCCWLARDTFRGISHSGDILNGQDLLDYVKINKDTLTDQEICVFISGYQSTRITRFLGTNPALLVADHVDKILYIIPVPLDAATIGDATICCPLVIKRDGDSLICSILSKATTDREMMCCSARLESPSFPEAIKRADFTLSASHPTAVRAVTITDPEADQDNSQRLEQLRKVTAKENAVIITHSTTLPPLRDVETTQIIRFGTGLEFQLPDNELRPTDSSAVVLPCIFGGQLQGPILLATGTVPRNVPFLHENELREYYNQLKNVVVIVDDRMTDNARNLATSYRINALFIVQLGPQRREPQKSDDILKLLDSTNINAVTALAGPQSLVLVQISDKYYFYRGIGNRAHLNTSNLAFGSDVTALMRSVGMEGLTDPRIQRMINLADEHNTVILPTSGQFVQPRDLQKMLEELPVNQTQSLEEDIAAAVPQLQMLLNQKELQELSNGLVSTLQGKVSNVTTPLRDAYVKFFTEEYKADDPESVKKKNAMLGELRKMSKNVQKNLGPLISSLANMMSSQTTSKRTHDLNRLIRKSQIKGNVEAAKTMTFETLAGYLEDHAEDMGVMMLNIETTPYRQLLGNLTNGAIDASTCCHLDSRILHLEGLDAGLIIEQSQKTHDGPLQSQLGPAHPTLAVPYLNQTSGRGSMLAWVCWDEFVNLKDPYTVRWMEKCNDTHIAALRIVMRSTLSQAVASREHNLQPGSPETGQLMSALLMGAMSKLAAMKSTPPPVSDEAGDTVTKLMRGLFGNLLTIAGSGVRPMSMVWQLFGLNSSYDIPSTSVDWVWYETVVTLYPYTGWPREKFYENLQRFLDKAIVRVVTKNERQAAIKSSRMDELVKFSKLRNIQLSHSRTIITIFMRMLTTEGINIAAVAARLLQRIPHKLDRQSRSYTDMINYVKNLAKGGQRRVHDDLTAASVYTGRSAAFRELKVKVADACQRKDWPAVKEISQSIVDEHARTANLWHVPPELLRVQNMSVYKELLTANLGDDVDTDTRSRNLELIRRVLGDAESNSVPWQVGKKGQFDMDIEPLDEAFVHEVVTGESPQSVAAVSGSDEDALENTTLALTLAKKPEDDFAEFKSTLQPKFIATMQEVLSGDDVCRILNIPASTMRIFIKALNPNCVWDDLGLNFRRAILGLLNDRSNRVESCPVKKLLDLEGRKLQVEG